MRQLTTLVALLVALVLGGTATAAPIIIDDFTNPGSFAMAGAGGNLSSLSGGTPTIAGGTRTISGSANFGLLEGGAIGANIPWGGVVGTLPSSFGVSTNASAIETFLTYSFPALSAIPNDSLTLNFALIDGGGTNPNMDFTAQFFSSLGFSSSVTISLPNNNTGTFVSIPFSAFTNLDTASISQVLLRINDGGSPQTSSDFILTQVAFTQTPEPATLAICGIFGIAGLVTARRKLKKSVEPTVAA